MFHLSLASKIGKASRDQLGYFRAKTDAIPRLIAAIESATPPEYKCTADIFCAKLKGHILDISDVDPVLPCDNRTLATIEAHNKTSKEQIRLIVLDLRNLIGMKFALSPDAMKAREDIIAAL